MSDDQSPAAFTPLGITPPLLLVAVAVMSTVPFFVTDLDLTVAGLFYAPDDARGAWPLDGQWPWTWLYNSSRVVTAIVAVWALGTLLFRWGRVESRRIAMFVLLTFLVGPGLLVNATFKDHWGRPRPNGVVEFGGTHHYVPPLVKGLPGKGESFPSGHASVGFACAAFWLAWRRDRPRLAKAALAGSIIIGSLQGLTRMVAGHHFLSDVMWSGVLSVGAAMLVYTLTLARPLRPPNAWSHRLRPILQAAYAAVALMILAVIFLANPMHRELRWKLDAGTLPPGAYSVEVDVDRGDVDIELVDARPDQPLVEVSGEIHGFGLPQNDVHRGGEVRMEGEPVVRYRVRHIGTFTSVSGRVELRLAADDVRRLVVHTGHGNIRVVRSSSAPLPELDLESGFGDIIRPPAGVHVPSGARDGRTLPTSP